LMIKDGRYCNRENGAGKFEGDAPVSNEQAHMIGMNAAGQTKLDGLRPNRDEVAIWSLHRHRVGEIDEMDCDGASAFPYGDIKETRSIDLNDRHRRVRPKNCVAQQLEVVGA